MLKKIFIIVFVLVIIAIGSAYFYRNMIVKASVEEGGTYALGVPTTLRSAGLDISGGSCELNDFSIANPEGFDEGYIITMRHGFLDLDEGSLFSEEVEIDSLILEGVSVNLLQQDTKGNYRAILDRINNLKMNGSSESSQSFRFRKIALREINLNASATIAGKQFDKSYKLHDLTLTDIGGTNGTSLSETTAIVIKRLLNEAVSVAATQSVLPVDVNQEVDKLKDEAKDKIEGEAKSLLNKLGGN